MTLPMYMLATRPQKRFGFSEMKSGPGLNPHSTSAASSTAVVPEPGIPSVSSGTSAPPVSELFAPSGAATPSTAPLPNSSGRRDTAFSTPYEMNEAMVEPAPGRTPIRNPSTEPCTNAKRQSFRSWSVGSRLRRPFGTGREPLSPRPSMHASTSPSANTPMATTTKSMPERSSSCPKVKREVVLKGSVPMPEIQSPTSIASSALSIERPASSTTIARPSAMSEKYSGALNASATLASGGDQHQADYAHRSGDERGDRRDAEGRAGAALAGHRIAVEAGDDRGRFAGDVQQDRSRGAAVLGAVVDAREHDHRARGIHQERERQEHRDGRRRAEPRHHAHHRAEHHADEAPKQVRRLQGDREPVHQPGKDVYAYGRFTPRSTGKSR